MNRTSLRKLGLWLLLPVWAAAVTVSVYLTFKTHPELMTVAEIGWILLQGSMIAIGTIIVANRPGNLVGRLILGAGVSFGAGWVIYVISFPMLDAGNVHAAGITEAVSSAATSLWAPLLMGAFLYFPDGKLPSPRWRWIGVLLWITGFLAVAAPLANGGWGGDETTAITPNPWRDALNPLGEALAAGFGFALVVVMAATVVGVIVKFRRSRDLARQQMKWLALSALILMIWFPIELAASGSIASTGVVALIGALVFVLALVAIAAAVLRYKLYEIDRIISRTVSYAAVVALIVGVFFASVTLLTSLLPSDSPLAVAASTLAVAALFNPVRKRVQDWVDHRFNRRRYQTQQVVNNFTNQLRDQTDVDQLTAGLGNLVQETLNPTRLGMWLVDRR